MRPPCSANGATTRSLSLQGLWQPLQHLRRSVGGWAQETVSDDNIPALKFSVQRSRAEPSVVIKKDDHQDFFAKKLVNFANRKSTQSQIFFVQFGNQLEKLAYKFNLRVCLENSKRKIASGFQNLESSCLWAARIANNGGWSSSSGQVTMALGVIYGCCKGCRLDVRRIARFNVLDVTWVRWPNASLLIDKLKEPKNSMNDEKMHLLFRFLSP